MYTSFVCVYLCLNRSLLHRGYISRGNIKLMATELCNLTIIPHSLSYFNNCFVYFDCFLRQTIKLFALDLSSDGMSLCVSILTSNGPLLMKLSCYIHPWYSKKFLDSQGIEPRPFQT